MSNNYPKEFIVCGPTGTFISGHLYERDADAAAKKEAAEIPGSIVSVYRRSVVFTSRVVVSDDRPQAAEPKP